MIIGNMKKKIFFIVNVCFLCIMYEQKQHKYWYDNELDKIDTNDNWEFEKKSFYFYVLRKRKKEKSFVIKLIYDISIQNKKKRFESLIGMIIELDNESAVDR